MLPVGKGSLSGISHVAFRQPGHHAYQACLRTRDLIATSCHENGKIFIHLAKVSDLASQAQGKDDRWITSTLSFILHIRVQDNITPVFVLWVVEWGNTKPIFVGFRDFSPQAASRTDIRGLTQDLLTSAARRTDPTDRPTIGRYLDDHRTLHLPVTQCWYRLRC